MSLTTLYFWISRGRKNFLLYVCAQEQQQEAGKALGMELPETGTSTLASHPHQSRVPSQSCFSYPPPEQTFSPSPILPVLRVQTPALAPYETTPWEAVT